MRKVTKYSVLVLITSLGILMALARCSWADSNTLTPPEDPYQSITFWKPHVIEAEEDLLAQKAHAIFSVLLRAWDNVRIEPRLYVVRSSSGPWAASLADGSILLTRPAIETTMQFGAQRGEHLLAFVLAHELALATAEAATDRAGHRVGGTSDEGT